MDTEFYCYLLECADGSYYVGHTDQLEYRLAQHHAGEGCKWTRTRRPVVLRWSEPFGTRHEALFAERQIKGWSRAKKRALIGGDFPLLSELAKKPRKVAAKTQARLPFDTALRAYSGRTGWEADLLQAPVCQSKTDWRSPLPVRPE